MLIRFQVTMNAILLMSFCLGNIVGPLTFTGASASGYVPAKVTIIVTCAAAICIVAVLQYYYVTENRKRERLAAEGGNEHKDARGFADVTDRKNKNFRYRL
jgi:hypothetical protein